MQRCNDTQQQLKERLVCTDKQLEGALATLGNFNNSTNLKAGVQMLYLYCLNMSKNPSVPCPCKIYTNNATFKNRVGNFADSRSGRVGGGF